jgi:hypothetical protein
MGSGLLRHVRALAHDWGQVLMFEGKSCSHFRSFTTLAAGYVEESTREHAAPVDGAAGSQLGRTWFV